MKEYPIKTRVELVAFKELEGESKTQITFQGFDASITDADLPLPPGEQLDHIQSLQPPNITVKDGIIYWDGKRTTNNSITWSIVRFLSTFHVFECITQV